LQRVFSALAVTALMVAMMVACAMPAIAASDNASCVGQPAAGQNSLEPGSGGAAIRQLAHFGLVADQAQANKEDCPAILVPLQ
jgi:hypothetical protein